MAQVTSKICPKILGKHGYKTREKLCSGTGIFHLPPGIRTETLEKGSGGVLALLVGFLEGKDALFPNFCILILNFFLLLPLRLGH